MELHPRPRDQPGTRHEEDVPCDEGDTTGRDADLFLGELQHEPLPGGALLGWDVTLRGRDTQHDGDVTLDTVGT
eukprot:2581193-Rhodomonas_salina.2